MQTILYWMSIVGILLTGTFVLSRQKKQAHVYYALFSYSVALWLITQYFIDQNVNTTFWLGLGFIATEIITPIFLAFTFAYPSYKFDYKRYGLILAAPLLLFGPYSFSKLLIIESEQSGNASLLFGPLYKYQTLMVLAYIVAGFIVLAIRLRKLSQQEKNQTYLFFAAFLPFLIGTLLSGIVFANNQNAQFLRPLSAFIMIAIISYAMVYKRLFDIKFFAIRAAAYTLTVLVLSVVYIAPAVYILGIVIMGFEFELSKFLVGVVFGTIAALNFGNLRSWFDKTTSKIFFRDSYDAAVVLGDLNKVLASTVDLSHLLHNSSSLIAQALKAEFCIFALNETKISRLRFIGTDNKKISASDMNRVQTIVLTPGSHVVIADHIDIDQHELKQMLIKNNVAVLVKLSSNVSDDENGFGYILLGYKKSGNSYNTKDATALEAMSDVLSIAIQNALRFEEIQKFNVTLQQRVDDATMQLRHTNAKLEALDETKDDFISMASHQLRTPLTAVKGYLSMVIEGDAGTVTPLQKKMLNQAFMSSQRMVFLIADLLNVSRLKTGKFVIDPVPLNLAHLISEEIGQLRETAASRSLELTFDKPKEFPMLLLDETKTRQVVMNFIDNALHYTPSGGHVRVELKDRPNAVELRVIDDGIGVPKLEQHHLFTKFYRAINARRERPDGTGLGLFMAKKVIVAQGGAVIFESKENKGSTFGFTIPKAKLLPKSQA